MDDDAREPAPTVEVDANPPPDARDEASEPAPPTASDPDGGDEGATATGDDVADADAPEDDEESESEEESEDDEPDGEEYERLRQLNIQRNRELMMSLSLNKMADKLKPTEEKKRRGPTPGVPRKKRGQVAPSRGSSRIQRLQEERKHTAWKDVHIEQTIRSHPHCIVELDIVCLGIADPERTLPDGSLIPAGFFAEGDFMSEPLFAWTDINGTHRVMWGDSEGEYQRYVETEDGGAISAGDACVCILREMQRRRLELLGATSGEGVSEPTGIRIHQAHLPPLKKEGSNPFVKLRTKPYVRKQKAHTKPKGITKATSGPSEPKCRNCGCLRENTTKMRPGPSGLGSLCNACGMYWATQGRLRPAGVMDDDYERAVPPGQEPAKPLVYKLKTTFENAVSSAPVGAAKGDEHGDDLPISAMKVPVKQESDEEDDDEEEEEEDEKEEDNLTAIFEPYTSKPNAFFQNMVKCARAGLVTPAMVGADDFPEVLEEGAPAPRWAAHIYAAYPPMVAVTEEAVYQVKTDPQNSSLAKAAAIVADSEPVIASTVERINDYPAQASYVQRSAAVCFAGYGALATGTSSPSLFPTTFAMPSMVRPRAYREHDIDGIALFGYTEPDVQLSLRAQLEKYGQKRDAEGEAAEAKERAADVAEAIAALEHHVSRARKILTKISAAADREARNARAVPRLEIAGEAAILCPPLPKADSGKGAKRVKGDGSNKGGGGDDGEPTGFLYEDVMAELEGPEDIPTPIKVMCGSAPRGEWQTYGRPREEKIILSGKGGDAVTPAEYERLGGCGQSKKWRKSIHVVKKDGSEGIAIGDYLAHLGGKKGESIVGRRIGLYWPLDECFYLGTVDEFMPTTGEHTVRYDDGEAEDLLLPMQRVKWLNSDVGKAGQGTLASSEDTLATTAKDQKTAEEIKSDEALAAVKAWEVEASAREAKRVEEEAKGILSPEGRNRLTLGAFDVWVNRPLQWRMKNSERRKCFEVLQILRSVPDPDDDPDDEDEPPRLLIEIFETLPTPRELPDYFEIIRCPMDCRGIERVLRRPAERSFASPWLFAVAIELMLTNAQVYNDEDSQIYEEAGMIRRAFVKAMEERFPNQPLPRPFTVYENVDEPAWMRPWGWTVPRPEDVADEPDPFGPLDWEQEAKAEDEERALARAMKAGAAMYGGAPVIIAKPRGRPPGRPRKEDPGAYARDDTNYDPRSRHGVSAHPRGIKRKQQTDLNLGPAANAAKDALDEAAEALTLDELVEAAEAAKAPELAGARRPGSTMLSILRQHPDIFVESLTGNGAVFTINERLVEYSEDDDEPAGPARKPTTRAKPKKSYADPDDDDFDDHDAVSPGERHGSKRKREEPHYDGMSPQQTDACKSILKKVKEMKDRDGRQVAELFILLPTRKQLPDYYKQIAHPIDFDSIGKCLNKQGGYQTVWKFLLACELMLSNAQVYNEEHSELWEDAATLRKAFIAELNKGVPGPSLPGAHVRVRREIVPGPRVETAVFEETERRAAQGEFHGRG
jgi:protein polybromo-1